MATVKIKFRPSTVDGGQGTIFYQVIHNRVARQQKTGYRLYRLTPFYAKSFPYRLIGCAGSFTF